MEYKLIQDDVFNHRECYYAHCISRDYALGAGIAVEFDRRYNMSYKLRQISKVYPKALEQNCIKVNNVFNLITKEKYWQKPTYDSLRRALFEMKQLIEVQIISDGHYMEKNDKLVDKNIYKLVMPKIGCGLDRLSWDKVEPMIQEIFKDLDIEIVVCYL